MHTNTLPVDVRNEIYKPVAPIDADVLYSRCLGNIAFANLLLDELASNGTQQLAVISQLAESGDALATAEAAHSLKGAAAIVGAESLRKGAAQLEAAGRENRSEVVSELIGQLRAEMDRCLSYIPALRKNMRPVTRDTGAT